MEYDNTLTGNKILVIDDENEIGWIFSKILGDAGYNIISTTSGKEGLKKLISFTPDLIFLDLKLPDENGIDILKKIKEIDSEIMVIMITAFETIHDAVAAMKLGAYDYIPKPIPNDRLKIIVDQAIEKKHLSKKVDLLTRDINALDEIVGQSPAIQKVFKLIQNVAQHDISVILRGESGTGKELVARAIHSLSKRKDKFFVPVDCATLPDTLVESELFGYEKGAFTGADSLKIGRFEMANEGTIFLDEIGNLAMHIQIKLLRVLQEGTVERLGGRKTKKLDVRIISATNKNLEEALETGEFRDDLYHRLNVFEITLPPLRERGDDLIILSQYFLNKFNNEYNKHVEGFSDEVMEIFRTYSWPGNVRELGNTIRASIILAKDKIMVNNLPARIRLNLEIHKNKIIPDINIKEKLDVMTLKSIKKNVVQNMEKQIIEQVLSDVNWNKTKASKILDIDYKSLYNKIKQYNIAKS